MKVVIKYAKQDSKGKIRLIDGFIYTADLRSNNAKTITKEINSIYDDYKGDYLEQYMEPKANVFCCYLSAEDDDIKPERFVFKSDISKKKDPIAILDGLIRRMKVDKISMSNGRFIQTFEGLKVDDRDKEDIIAKKYTYEYQKDITTGKNVRFMLSYRDTAKAPDIYSFNQQYVNNCIPFCFLLEGEITSEYMSDDEYGYYEETNTYRLYMKKQKIILDNRILLLLNGEMKIKTITNLGEDDIEASALCNGLDDGETRVVGLFYSGLKANKYEMLRMNSWYSFVLERYDAKITRSRLEDMIADGKYVEVNPFAEFGRDVHRKIVRELKGYGLKLFEQTQNGKKRADDLIMLSHKQSKAILDSFGNSEDASNVVSKIKSTAWKYLKDGKICKENIASFTDDLCKDSPEENIADRPHEYSFANFRTAVHEIGHALVMRQVFGRHAFNKITIVPDSKTKGMVFLNEKANINYDFSGYSNEICDTIASKIAEEMFFGAAGRGWYQDMQCALGYMIYLIKNYATFDIEDGRICCYLNRSDAIPADDALDVLMDQYMEKTRKMLADKKDLILELAGNIMIEQEVSGERFEEMCAFYEEKQNVRKDRELCEKLHFVIETSMQYNRDKETSKAFINLLTTPGKEFIFHKMFKYHPEIDPGCGAVSMINAMLGYNLFSKDGLKPISSKLSEYGGAIGLVVDKDGKNFAVFIDGSDRTGKGEGIRLIHGKKRGKFVKYDTIDTATKLIYVGENGSCCKINS